MIPQKLKICTGGCQLPKKIWKNYEGEKFCQNCWRKKTEELTKSSPEAKPTKQNGISPRSLKRSKEEKLYQAKRIIFLSKHPVCKMKIENLCTIKATDIQHLKGRTGELLLDENFWMPACRGCHSYADTHPQEAFENGWALKRI